MTPRAKALGVMADFVLATGLPPSVYWDTPREETNAVLTAYNRRQKERAKAVKRG